MSFLGLIEVELKNSKVERVRKVPSFVVLCVMIWHLRQVEKEGFAAALASGAVVVLVLVVFS